MYKNTCECFLKPQNVPSSHWLGSELEVVTVSPTPL